MVAGIEKKSLPWLKLVWGMRRHAFMHSPGERIVFYFVWWLRQGLLQSDLFVNSKIAKVMEAEVVIGYQEPR